MLLKRWIGRVLVGIFILSVAIMAAIIYKSYLDQEKERDQQREIYQQMIREDGKTPLTQETLEQDFEFYVKNVNRGRTVFRNLLILFGVAFAQIVIMILYTGVVRVLEDRRVTQLIGSIVSAAVIITMFVVVAWVVKTKIIPRMYDGDPEDEAHYYVSLDLADAKKEEKVVYDSDNNSRTEVTYYLIKTDGGRIQTDKVMFERYEKPGVYYAGRTDKTVFSLYPALYFELKDK